MKKIYLLIFPLLILFTGCNGNGIDSGGPIIVPPEIDVTYSKGNANASVVITEYSDYECPFCSRKYYSYLKISRFQIINMHNQRVKLHIVQENKMKINFGECMLSFMKIKGI
jgi:hypothetical protein